KMKNGHIVVKYIRLYFNNTITKCDWQRYRNSQLFLGVKDKVRTCLLAKAIKILVILYAKI
ncbi:MAG: hypothetical protein ACP5U0_09020, partial [Caldisphaera sp.]